MKVGVVWSTLDLGAALGRLGKVIFSGIVKMGENFTGNN